MAIITGVAAFLDHLAGTQSTNLKVADDITTWAHGKQ